MRLIVFLLLATSGNTRQVPDSLRPEAVACLGEATLVAISGDQHLMRHEETGWQRSEIDVGYRGLWRAPDGRLFTFDWKDHVAAIWAVREGEADPQRWRLALPELGFLRFAVLGDSLIATSRERIFRLRSDGSVEGLPPPPHFASVFGLESPPVLVGSLISPIVCTSTSLTEAHHSMGYCRGPGPARYEYRVEFGSGLSAKDEDRDGNGVEPFACGEVLISARKPGTQARRLADGTLVGRAVLYARKGSACLPGDRVLIVDKREVGTFAVPNLRPLWRRKLPMTIESATFCGGKVAILPSSKRDLTFLEVPP